MRLQTIGTCCKNDRKLTIGTCFSETSICQNFDRLSRAESAQHVVAALKSDHEFTRSFRSLIRPLQSKPRPPRFCPISARSSLFQVRTPVEGLEDFWAIRDIMLLQFQEVVSNYKGKAQGTGYKAQGIRHRVGDFFLSPPAHIYSTGIK